MKKIVLIYIVMPTLLAFALSQNGFSWDDKVTHRDISEVAAEKSNLSKSKGNYLINLGLDKGLLQELKWGNNNLLIKKWLAEGAELEDAGSKWDAITGKARFNNHFHNPLKPWSQAGLDDWVGLHYTGESSLLWAQDGNKQKSIVEYRGDWSWQKTRDYFYDALISISDTVRQENFVKTFRGLGQQMHLLQDTAVPDHVRNDAHPEDALFGKSLNGNPYFESWAKNNPDIINAFAASPIYPNVSFNVSYNGLAPVTQLFDAELYDGLNASAGINQGLAEYANANFFSGDTIFSAERYSPSYRHYFPFPKKSSTDLQSYISGTKPAETFTDFDGSIETGTWISKLSDGETVDHLLKTSIFTRALYYLYGENEDFYNSFYRDEKCHEDYASKLIPRAVGYSARLLDYFFRGTINIAVPSNGIYSMIDATQQDFNPAFTAIKLKATNTTTTGENMTNGTIQLVVKYKVAQTDPFVAGPVATTSQDFSYIVVPEQSNVNALYSATPTELNFDLSQNPVPLWATDVYLQVVFKGTLGTETNAVAVGFKDISEPTPIDFTNNMDKICIYGSWYNAGSSEAIAQVDTNPKDGIANEFDVYAHDEATYYVKFAPYSTTHIDTWASPTVHDFLVSSLAAGSHIRASYILSDYQFDYSIYNRADVKKDSEDPWPHYDYLNGWIRTAIKRQKDYSEDSGLCGGLPSCYIDRYPEYSDHYPADGALVFYNFRGISLYWGGQLITINNPYPANSQCSYDLL